MNAKSNRGSLISRIDKLIFEILKTDRGFICQIHNKQCGNISPMHILSKRSHPRLRFNRKNIILAGWFCSHFWTHHDPDDERAKFAFKRIEELLGERYKEELLKLEVCQPKHSMFYLKCLELSLKKEKENKETWQ